MNVSDLNIFVANYLATAGVGGQRSVPWTI